MEDEPEDREPDLQVYEGLDAAAERLFAEHGDAVVDAGKQVGRTLFGVALRVVLRFAAFAALAGIVVLYLWLTGP